MQLTPGSKLSHFEILSPLGVGGMGEVYRALDTTLRREVAIKLLPAEFASDPERIARFRREAQLLAQLNHPNIATIHGLFSDRSAVQPVSERYFLVMELVAGETLAEVIRDSRLGTRDSATNQNRASAGATTAPGSQHGLPIDDALSFTVQICEALEHAHEKGIIHRDLKPANVKVTPEGKVKVLDFGLAKAFAADGSSGAAGAGAGAAAGAMTNATLNDGTTDLSPAYVAQPLTASPTIPGVILGTAAYMSPEQARGKPVDKRTDIWALGCVLYEMLTGVGAFAKRSQSRARQQAVAGAGADPDRLGANVQPLPPGRGSDNEPDTAQDIIARILTIEPDWSLLPAITPAFLRGILRRCLQKDKDERARSAADIALQIREVRRSQASAESESRPAGPLTGPLTEMPAPLKAAPAAGWKRLLVAGLAGALVALGGALAYWKAQPAPAPPAVSRLTITLPPGQHLAALDQPAIAISPDGKNLVYVASQSRDREGADTPGRVLMPGEAAGSGPLADARGTVPGTATQLYLRPLDSNEAKPIAGTDSATGPFFSPDGQWIGFFAGGKLKKVSVSGGAVVTLASAPSPGGASWSSQGILALQGAISLGLQQVPQEGGASQPLTRLGSGELIHRWPEFLPGGQALFFAGSSTVASWNVAQIAVQPTTGGERKNLTQGTAPRYAATGHLLHAQAGTLMAAPFDAQRLALTGAAVPALEGVMQINATGAAQYSVSSTGTLAFLAGGVTGSQSRMVWVSRNGEEQLLPAPPHTYQFPRISPDGRRAAVQVTDQDTQIWVYDFARNTLTRLTFEGSVNNLPAWSSDGSRVAFRSNRVDPANLYWQLADGSGGAERLITRDYSVPGSSSFSPDGQLLAFTEQSPETNRDISVLNLKDRKAVSFLKSPYEETAAKFSPDGKWLAYSSDESGRREIYVQPYPGPGGKWQISTDGGQEPVWNPKGGELFFRSGSKIMAVVVQVGQASRPALQGDRSGDLSLPGFTAGTPRMLFDGPYLPTTGSFPYYDVSPDGQRFLMLKPLDSQAAAPTQINIVLNWFEELKQKVPVK